MIPRTARHEETRATAAGSFSSGASDNNDDDDDDDFFFGDNIADERGLDHKDLDEHDAHEQDDQYKLSPTISHSNGPLLSSVLQLERGLDERLADDNGPADGSAQRSKNENNDSPGTGMRKSRSMGTLSFAKRSRGLQGSKSEKGKGQETAQTENGHSGPNTGTFHDPHAGHMSKSRSWGNLARDAGLGSGRRFRQIESSNARHQRMNSRADSASSGGGSHAGSMHKSRSWGNLNFDSAISSGLAYTGKRLQQGTTSIRNSVPLRHKGPAGQPKRQDERASTTSTTLNDLVQHVVKQAHLIEQGEEVHIDSQSRFTIEGSEHSGTNLGASPSSRSCDRPREHSVDLDGDTRSTHHDSRGRFLQGSAGFTKASKFAVNRRGQVAQRESPKRGRSASCFWEVLKQINPFHKPSIPSFQTALDERIGQELEVKTLRERARDEWELVDTNRDGKATFREVKHMFKRLNVHVPAAEIRKWMNEFDADGNGSLDFNEFESMFESIQSKPNMFQEFILAKILGSGADAVAPIANGDLPLTDLRLGPEDLAKFVAWSTNDEERPTVLECAYRIYHFERDRRIYSDPAQPWMIPAHDQWCVNNVQSSPALDGFISPSVDSLLSTEENCPPEGPDSIQVPGAISGQANHDLSSDNLSQDFPDLNGAASSAVASFSSDLPLSPRTAASASSNSSILPPPPPHITVNSRSVSLQPTTTRARVESDVSTHSAPTQPNIDSNHIARRHHAKHASTPGIMNRRLIATKSSLGSAFVRPRRGSDTSSNTTGDRATGGKRRRIKRFLSRMRVRARSQDSETVSSEGMRLLSKHQSSAATQLPDWHPASPEYVAPELTYDSFVSMLVDGVYNQVGDVSKLQNVYQDMHQPLSHYFISSSHNSYLSGNQINSESTAYAITRALRLGVRVIELDAWNGAGDEPIVTHGNTLCKPLPFRDCIVALRKHGFDASDFPVIITIENHCSMEQQRKQVYYLEAILGDDLFHFPTPNEDNLKEGVFEWLSPYDLRRKFVIRDRPAKRMTKADRIEIKMRKLELQEQLRKQRREQYEELRRRQTASASRLRRDSSSGETDAAALRSSEREKSPARAQSAQQAEEEGPVSQMSNLSNRSSLSNLSSGFSNFASFTHSNPMSSARIRVESLGSSSAGPGPEHSLLPGESSPSSPPNRENTRNSVGTAESADADDLEEMFEEGAEQSDEELLDVGDDNDGDDGPEDEAADVGTDEDEDLDQFGRDTASIADSKSDISEGDLPRDVLMSSNELRGGSTRSSPARSSSSSSSWRPMQHKRSSGSDTSMSPLFEEGTSSKDTDADCENGARDSEHEDRLSRELEAPQERAAVVVEKPAPRPPPSVLNSRSSGSRGKANSKGPPAKQSEEFTPSILAQYVDESRDGVTPSLLRLMYIKNVPIPVHKSETSDVLVFDAPRFCSSSSLSEQKMRKLAMPGPRAAALCTYSKNHLLRVFPAGSRITSSNYDPVPAWNAGCQIVALNYQNFGAEVWLNQGKFADNGGCGYVLKPEAMLKSVAVGVNAFVAKSATRDAVQLAKAGANVQMTPETTDDDADAIELRTANGHDSAIGGSYGIKPPHAYVSDKVKRMLGHQNFGEHTPSHRSLPWALEPGDASFDDAVTVLEVSLISGHYLPRPPGVGTSINPYVEITVRGLEQDDYTVRSTWVEHNGFDPFWGETFRFEVHNVELSLLSFIVRTVDSSRAKKGRFVCQNVFPLKCLRQGFRYVPMRHANGALTDDGFLFCKISLSSKKTLPGGALKI